MLRLHFFFLVFLMVPALAAAQMAPAGTDRQIAGQVRIDGRPAPQGIQVLLDRSRGHDASFSTGTGELNTAMTDSRGRFSFERIDGDSRVGDGRTYVVTVRCQGYRTASQIVDLTATPRGYVNIDLQRDTSRDAPNVPAEGPGGTVSASQPSSSAAREALARGQQRLLEKHDAKGSIEYFRKAVKSDPRFAPGYLLLGTAYMQTGEFAEAQSAFEKASQVGGPNAIALIGMGAALNAQQRWADAQEPLLRGLELKPDSAEGHYEAARGLWALGRWQQADPHLSKAIALNKDYPGPHVLMGNIYLRRRNANSALDEYREYLRLDPQGGQAEEVRKMVAKIEKALAER